MNEDIVIIARCMAGVKPGGEAATICHPSHSSDSAIVNCPP